jgi:hypothetical protein
MKLLNVIIILTTILILLGSSNKIKLFDNDNDNDNDFNWRQYLENTIGKKLGYKNINFRVYSNYTNDSVFKNISNNKSLFINSMLKKYNSCNISSKNILNDSNLINKKYNRCILYGVDENDGSPIKYLKNNLDKINKRCGEVIYLQTGTRAILKDIINLKDKKTCKELINKIDY